MAVLAPVTRQRFFSADGSPLAGGKVYTYEAGTTTPKTAWKDANKVTEHSNPIFLDSEGKMEDELYLEGVYKIAVYSSDDILQYEDDNIDPLGVGDYVPRTYADLATALADSALQVGDRGSVSGISDFEIVDTSEVAVNGVDVIQSSNPSLAIALIKESAPLQSKPLKLPPSKDDFIKKAVAETLSGQVSLGHGKSSIGASATDMVYRTARNTEGGTDGTFDVIARFAVEITDLANSIVFTVQLDPSYLGGVTVQGISTDDSDLNTASISNFAFTDNGGGNFTFGPWTSSGAKSYYGFEVKLNPVDTTNDATLHDEFFVIQSMSIVQNSNDLLNSTESLSGSTWAQQIFKALPRPFTEQVLASANANDVFVTHTQNVSGSFYRWAYTATDGLSTNDGTQYSELDLETARGLLNSGALELLLMKGGNYTFAGQKPRDIFTLNSECQRVVCTGSEAIIDAGNEILFSSMTPSGAHYEVAYTEVNHYNASLIGAGTATPKIVCKTLNKNFTEVSTAGEVDTTDFAFYWDNVAKEFLIRFDGTLTDDVVVCEAGNLFIGDNIGYFGAANIYMSGVQAAFLDIDGGRYYETYNTGTRLGNAAGEVYNIDDISGVQVSDYIIKAQADGFNYHGSGHTELFNCVAEYCKDDGISHHDDCTGLIQGGRYDYNGKSGVIPAFGAYVEAVDVSCIGNKLGDSPLAQAGNYGGFTCLSNDDDTSETTLITFDCIADDNYYSFLSSGGQSKLVVYRASIVLSAEKDFASLTWAENTIAGRLDLVQSEGTYAYTPSQSEKISIKI